MNRSYAAYLAASILALSLTPSCAKQAAEQTVLQSSDLETDTNTATFDPNEILDLASFTDAQGLGGPSLQAFLERTPYDRGSFLATYSSNGVRAVDAITRAAAHYSLNPLVFLVRAEADEGLVGEEFYPSPPSRVEYVFNCGCQQNHASCDPALAGFDVQVDCLGRTLRASLDQIAKNGQTDGGWAPSATTRTLDGVEVTPADASTAALYQYTPQVSSGAAGGTWLFWNLWQKYAAQLNYFSSGGGATATAWIGDSCTGSGDCQYPGGVCATNYPGGLCTATCTDACPSDTIHGPSFCADFQAQGGFCLPLCNPAAPACRSGYSCIQVAKYGDASSSANACVPQ